MPSSRTLTATALAVLLVGLGMFVGLGGSATATVASTGSQTFTDPSGDNLGAPDITTVTVSDDYSSGTIQFTVTAVGYMTIDAGQQPHIDVYIDADRNSATGSPSGSEYGLFAGRDATGAFWDAGRWDGSEWTEMAQSPTMTYSRSADTATWRLNKSDLGGTTSFNFAVVTAVFDGAGNIVGVDRAPDGGVYGYTLSAAPAPPTTTTPAAPVKPVIGLAKISPRPTAGKRAIVTFAVTRSDTGAALTRGTMICDPSVQGKVVPHQESFRAGTARLVLTIPRSARGKTLKVRLTIKLGSQSATRTANFHVA